MISLTDIKAAETRISPHIIRTPVVFSPTISKMSGANVFLKLETLQKAGSFKVRGATNKILYHINLIGEQGVIAASAGNHAQGVAVAAYSAGIPATIVMPEWSFLSKQEATKGYGAQVIIHGQTLEESIGRAQEIASQGPLFIHPYDDDEVIAGQGTIALEILADLPETDMIISTGRWRRIDCGYCNCGKSKEAGNQNRWCPGRGVSFCPGGNPAWIPVPDSWGEDYC